MKKIVIWLLVLALGILPMCASGEEAAADELVVANTTRMNGNFFSSMWGNVTSDLDVQRLIHGYNLVTWDKAGTMYREDRSVVSGVLKTMNEEGDYSFLLNLYPDLCYSDGSAITAWDYAFSFLFEIAPEIVGIGGTPLRLEHLKGYREYISGESKALAGVRVIDDLELMITLDHEYLPFFYEMGLLYCNPIPIREIAPGCKVYDDGEGVYIAGENDPEDKTAFSSELLRETVLDPEKGYLSHPAVVSGPYMLTGFDGVTATFEANPYFKGTEDNIKPSIKKLTYTLGDNGTMIADLKDGKLGLLNKVTNKDTILAGIEAGLKLENYPRTGLAYISFLGESVPVQSQNVRQAIAYCMDKNELVAGYTGMYGTRVDGYYGIGQWVYGLINGTVPPPVEDPENEEEMAVWEALNLDGVKTYETGSTETDIQEAVRLLEEDGWLQEEGAEVRSKEIDGVRYTLELKLLYPEENRIAELMEEHFVNHLAEAGIRLELVPMENSELLRTYYHQRERNADMLYLGTNFHPVFDPSVSFMTSPVIENWPDWNNGESSIQALDDLAVSLRQTEPGNVLEYCRNWIRFQECVSETLPIIPVYSNIYFDFFTDHLENYHADSNVTWAEAIVPAYLGAGEAAEE